jgi:hypothetical protein
MFIVIENRVYAFVKNASGKYPLVSITKDASGAITIKDKGEGITTLPVMYKKMTLEEVIAAFNIADKIVGDNKEAADTNEHKPFTEAKRKTTNKKVAK